MLPFGPWRCPGSGPGHLGGLLSCQAPLLPSAWANRNPTTCKVLRVSFPEPWQHGAHTKTFDLLEVKEGAELGVGEVLALGVLGREAGLRGLDSAPHSFLKCKGVN